MTTQNIIESWESGVEPYNATTHIFEPRHKCPRCGSKAIYYKREGKRINIVRCELCTALWKEKSECLAGPGQRIGTVQ